IELNSTVVNYCKDFPDPTTRAITIRHLLTHRSGLRHWDGDFLDVQGRLVQKPADVVRFFAAIGLLFPAGRQEIYSSLGYMTLGIVLEQVTGSTYASLLRTRVFEPLGMRSSSLDDHATIVSGRSRSYRY